MDSQGNVYFRDVFSRDLRKIDASTGAVSTTAILDDFAGGGELVLASDESALIDAVDSVLRVDLNDGGVTAYAGTGQDGPFVENAPALEVNFGLIRELALDDQGNLFLSDAPNRFGNAIRRIAAGPGQASTLIAGGFPEGIAIDGNSTYFVDAIQQKIHRLRLGVVTTVAGTGESGTFVEGQQATTAPLDSPRSIAVADHILTVVLDGRVALIDLATDTIATVPGAAFTGLNRIIHDVTFDNQGRLLFSTNRMCNIYRTEEPVVPSACGNSDPELGEECDDGNLDPTDACTNDCREAVCGDGIRRTDHDPATELGEECDGSALTCDNGATLCNEECRCQRCILSDGLVDTDCDGIPDVGRAKGRKGDLPCSPQACQRRCYETAGCDPEDPKSNCHLSCDSSCLDEVLSGECADNCRTIRNGVGTDLPQRDWNEDGIGEKCQEGWRVACAAGTYVRELANHGALVRDTVKTVGSLVPYVGDVLDTGMFLFAASTGAYEDAEDFMPQVPEQTPNYVRAQAVFSDAPELNGRIITAIKFEAIKPRPEALEDIVDLRPGVPPNRIPGLSKRYDRLARSARLGVLIWDLDNPQHVYYAAQKTVRFSDECALDFPFCLPLPYMVSEGTLKLPRDGVYIPEGRAAQITVGGVFGEQIKIPVFGEDPGEPPPDPWCTATSPLGDTAPVDNEEYGAKAIDGLRSTVRPWLALKLVTRRTVETINSLASKNRFGDCSRDTKKSDIGLRCSQWSSDVYGGGAPASCAEFGQECGFGSCFGYDENGVGVCEALVVNCERDADCNLGTCVNFWQSICQEELRFRNPLLYPCDWKLRKVGNAWTVKAKTVGDDGTNLCGVNVEGRGINEHIYANIERGAPLQSVSDFFIYPGPPTTTPFERHDWLCTDDDGDKFACPSSGW